MLIRVMTMPAGPGFSAIRRPYLGCAFALADPGLVANVRKNFFTGLAVEAPSGYAVLFTDVLRGLRSGGQSDWADYLAALKWPPQLLFFPEECAQPIA